MNKTEKTISERDYRVDSAALRGDWPLLLLLAADIAYGFIMWPSMPEVVPTHWGISGQADGYGPAWIIALGLPAMSLATYALLLFLPLIDPRRRNYALFGGTVRFVRWLVALFLIGLHFVLVRVALGDDMDVAFVIRLGIALLFTLLGNQMGRMRQNFFIGIRVPWTLSSEEVWNRTHRLAGRIWVAGGLAMIAAAFLPPPIGVMVFVAIAVVLAVVPIVYSWWIYRDIGAR